jgi:hypothetical protein
MIITAKIADLHFPHHHQAKQLQPVLESFRMMHKRDRHQKKLFVFLQAITPWKIHVGTAANSNYYSRNSRFALFFIPIKLSNSNQTLYP